VRAVGGDDLVEEAEVRRDRERDALVGGGCEDELPPALALGAQLLEEVLTVGQGFRRDRGERGDPALERRLAARKRQRQTEGGERSPEQGAEELLVECVAAHERAVEIDAEWKRARRRGNHQGMVTRVAEVVGVDERRQDSKSAAPPGTPRRRGPGG